MSAPQDSNPHPLLLQPEEKSAVKESHEGATSFTVFPKLPMELQLRIWKEATLVPRLVNVTVIRARSHATGERSQIFEANSRLPSLLTTCNISRRVFLKTAKCLQTNLMEVEGGKIYYQPVDTVILWQRNSCNSFHSWLVSANKEPLTAASLAGIEHLALHYRSIQCAAPNTTLDYFTGRQSITVLGNSKISGLLRGYRDLRLVPTVGRLRNQWPTEKAHFVSDGKDLENQLRTKMDKYIERLEKERKRSEERQSGQKQQCGGSQESGKKVPAIMAMTLEEAYGE